MRNNQYENVYTEKCNEFVTAIAAGNFPASTAYIDVSNFTHFCFKIFAGTLDTALVCQVKQDTSATETASIKDVTGATLTVGTGDDNEWMIIEVEVAKLDINNNFRYVTLAVGGAAGSNDYLCIVFEGWAVRHVPVTQPAGYSAHVLIAG
jgi:hypothetical protein